MPPSVLAEGLGSCAAATIPEMSVKAGCAADTVPSSAIAERLARFRGLTLLPFEVTALSLVAVRPPTRAYFQWEVVGHYALGIV